MVTTGDGVVSLEDFTHAMGEFVGQRTGSVTPSKDGNTTRREGVSSSPSLVFSPEHEDRYALNLSALPGGGVVLGAEC